ncbi:hypothetical protein [Crocosphaera chwakensis]|uniref:Phosphomannomutase n=1 Tax=Crocosphaera chwakensis CCY0110 TaxID=391612 RepID=A3IML5_9CHRO|nr:hypothetical protein [Crocosphaera chwakensis]EAZ92384.1 hypothetical protein CY0110_28534 [Crocosphaera chwakensis CCY0110]
MNEPSTVTYTTADILKRIEDKLDKLDDKIDKQSEKIGGIEVKMATLTEKVEGIDNRLKVVEGTQKSQVWALIVLLGGAIVTAGARLFFTNNP